MAHQRTLTISSRGRGTIDISAEIARVVAEAGIDQGLCNLFIRHTSASLIISENADPSVRRDLEMLMARLVPDGDPEFTHTLEGDDDMAAHVRAVLTQTALTIPVSNGQLALGRWQGIYLWEHRYQAHRRQLLVTVM